MNHIEVRAVTKTFDRHTVLDRLSLIHIYTRKAWRTRKRATSRFSAMPRCVRATCTMTVPISCAERSLP